MLSRTSVPPVTRGLLLGLLVVTLVNYVSRYHFWTSGLPGPGENAVGYASNASYTAIVPSVSILYPWTFLSATFAEQNMFGFGATVITLFYGGRYLERAWSSRELAKFVLLISLIPNILTCATYLMLFALTKQEKVIDTMISGGTALQIALLVSFKQLIPEYSITLFRGVASARVKHFPAAFIFVNTVSGMFIGTDTSMLLAWFGFLTSWTYLRFYRLSPASFTTATNNDVNTGFAPFVGETIRGDASDTFAFASFFPDAIQPPIAVVSNAIYGTLVHLHICTPFTSADIAASNEQVAARGNESQLSSLMQGEQGTASRIETERRRALALKALDERLHTHRTRKGPSTNRTELPVAVPETDPASQDVSCNSQLGPLMKMTQEEAMD